MGRSGHFIFLEVKKILKHFLHHLILAEAVDKIHTRFPPADSYHPVHNVKIGIHRQKFIQVIHIFRKGGAHLFLICACIIHKKLLPLT